MDIFLYIIIFIIGTLFGSFFTLAVYRIPLKQDITHKRSYCPNCNHKLGFLDMIPILSYICLKRKCRYCGQKIRPRYLILEILSGIVFVLFAMSIKLSVYTTDVSTLVYFVFGLIYITTLFIIAGIDKENHKIEKSVLLFGYIMQTLYIIYLYIVEKDPNVYRYVIYLLIVFILSLINTFYLRKKVKNSYALDVLQLCILFLMFTYEAISILTIDFTLLAIAISLIAEKLLNVKPIKQKKEENKENKENKEEMPVPVGFYLCITNIICLIVANYYIFF